MENNIKSVTFSKEFTHTVHEISKHWRRNTDNINILFLENKAYIYAKNRFIITLENAIEISFCDNCITKDKWHSHLKISDCLLSEEKLISLIRQNMNDKIDEKLTFIQWKEFKEIETFMFSMPTKDFTDGINTVKHAYSKSVERANLESILLRSKFENEIEFIATDGHRLSQSNKLYKWEASKDKFAPFQINVPIWFMLITDHLLSLNLDLNNEIQIESGINSVTDETLLCIKGANLNFYITFTSYTYPEIDLVIPSITDEAYTKFTFDAKSCRKTLKELKSHSNLRNEKGCYLIGLHDKIILESLDAKNSIQMKGKEVKNTFEFPLLETLCLDGREKVLKVAKFSTQFILDGLMSVANGKTVDIYIATASEQILLKGEHVLEVIMPQKNDHPLYLDT